MKIRVSIIATTLFALLFILVLAAPDTSVSAKKKTATKDEEAVMENVNITWDLEKGKTDKVKTHYNVIGYKKFKVKMTKYKVTTTKSGKKKISFTLKCTGTAPNISEIQGEEMLDRYFAGESLGGMYYLCLVDYKKDWLLTQMIMTRE